VNNINQSDAQLSIHLFEESSLGSLILGFNFEIIEDIISHTVEVLEGSPDEDLAVVVLILCHDILNNLAFNLPRILDLLAIHQQIQ
jgi:hypothetical protein